MNKYKLVGKVLLVSTAIVLMAAGCNKATTTESTTTPTTNQDQQQASSQAITYDGQDGKTALDLLKTNYQVETQDYSGIGEFVKSINGISPDKDHFWAFYVNGASSNVGASQYQSKSTDKIEWKLDAITNDAQ